MYIVFVPASSRFGRAMSQPQDHLPLAASSFHILCTLLKGPRYPYRIAHDVAKETAGKVRLEAGNLHRNLQRLLRDGLLEEVPAPASEESTDGRRRYYALTPLGHGVLTSEIGRMEDAVRLAGHLLAEGR